MGQLVAVELLKIRKRMMTWILLAILVAFMALYVILSYLSVTSFSQSLPSDTYNALTKALQFPLAFTLVLAVVQSIGIILVIILAASTVGNEYSWGTVAQIIGRTGRRSDYVGSKVTSLIIVILSFVFIGLVLGFLLTIFTSYKLAGTLNWSFFDLSFAGKLLKMFGWTAFTILDYGLLAVLFATLGRSVIAGIGGTLGYHFIELILIGVLNNSMGWTHRIPDYLMGHNMSALLQTGVDHGPLSAGNGAPSGIHATIVLLVYGAVFIGLVLRLFRRQDLSA